MGVKISGFMWLHNGCESGYPFVQAITAIAPYIDEMVVVDMQSTDTTRKVLEHIKVRILDGQWWSGKSEECLTKGGFDYHTSCINDIIWVLEADEVWDTILAAHVSNLIQDGVEDILVPRVQVEQNFQRVRWYPGQHMDRVHRIFRKGTVTRSGHSTKEHLEELRPLHPTDPAWGFIWDCANCFRDNWLQRVKNQAELWGETPQYRYVPKHFTESPAKYDSESMVQALFLSQPLWTWRKSPFELPVLLSELVGQTQYDPWPLANYLRGDSYVWQR